MNPEPSLLLRSAPKRADLAPRQSGLDQVFGRYLLYHEIPCSPPDRCYHAFAMGIEGYEKPLFLRTFPAALLTAELIESMKRQVVISVPGVEEIYDLGRHEEQGYLCSDLLNGASLAQLGEALPARGQRLSFGLALAIYREARAHLAALHERGLAHGQLRPTLIRLSPGFRAAVFLCRGLCLHETPHDSDTRDEDIFGLATHVFGLAAGELGQRVTGLLADRDPAGFAVLCDLIVAAEPRLEEVAVEILWPESGQAAPAAADRVLATCVTPDEIQALWELVAECAAGGGA